MDRSQQQPHGGANRPPWETRRPPWEQTNSRKRSRSPHRNGDRQAPRHPDPRGYRNRDDTPRAPPTAPWLDRNNQTLGRDRPMRPNQRRPLSNSSMESGAGSTQRQQQQTTKKDDNPELEYDNPIPLEEWWAIEPEVIRKVMHFSQFSTTTETKVPGNSLAYGVHKTKTSQARQYMNRPGGFNRPLSPTRGNQFAKVADTSGIEKK